MPSSTERQRRFMAMKLRQAERGERTGIKMTRDQLRDFARKPTATRGRRSRRR